MANTKISDMTAITSFLDAMEVPIVDLTLAEALQNKKFTITLLKTLFDNTATWTPADQSGAALVLSDVTGTYTKIGERVIAQAQFIYPATADGTNTKIGGLPFDIVAGNSSRMAYISYSDYGSGLYCLGNPSSDDFGFYNLSGVALTNANLSGKTISMCIIYKT